MNPFFSIVVPTYNRADILHETIESVLKQTYTDYELLIVDDGSTDNTKEVIKNSYSKNEQITYYWKENGERGAARNLGIQQSKGEYVIFLDSDDLFTPHHLYLLREKIISTKYLNFYASKTSIIGQHKNGITKELKKLQEGLYGLDIMLRGNPFSCNFCIRKNNPQLKLFRKDREFSTSEDWIFLVENLYKDQIYVIDKASVLMRDHPTRSMRSNNQLIIRTRLKALDWLIENYKLNNNQLKLIKGYSFYFCSIHCYLENNRLQGIHFINLSIKEIGVRFEILLLLLKILIGNKNIMRLTKYV